MGGYLIMYIMRVGTASQEIDLVEGFTMIGFGARISGSEGTHDKLYIKSIILSNDKTRILFVAADLMGLSKEFTKELETEIENKTDIPTQNIIISSTHTHSGPASMMVANVKELDYTWMNELKMTFIECACRANEKLTSSIVDFCTGTCNIGLNRVLERNGLIKRALKEVDNQVNVMVIRDKSSGEVDSLIVNYACHPVTLTQKNMLFSADYPCYTIMKLKKNLPDINVMFTNGCCGDINPIEMNTFESAEKLGFKFADSVLEILKNNSDTNSDNKKEIIPDINVKSFEVDIQMSYDLNKTTLKKMEYDLVDELLKTDISNSGGIVNNLKWVKMMQDKLNKDVLPKALNAPIKVVKIGTVCVVTLPFEVFHEIGLKIKKYFSAFNTMVLGYANGVLGYLPSKRLYDMAPYEAGKSCMYYLNPGPVSIEGESKILDAIAKKL